MTIVRHILACVGLLSALGGCSSVVPTSGPLSEEITRKITVNNTGDYVLVDINHDTVKRLTEFHPVGLSQRFKLTRAKSPNSLIGIGDVLAITIWEAGEGGLFSNATTKNITIPALAVDRAGSISLPYAGTVKVAGSTPTAVQTMIVKRLADRAIHPQVTVSIVKNESNTVVLSGDVTTPGRQSLSAQGDRLLDVIASAGGAKFPAQEVYVTFVRGKTRGSQLLKTIVENQDENIFVSAGDRIYLTHEPRRYSVFGAVEKPGIYPFATASVNLLESVAGAGGLMDQRADATGIFVFRYEPAQVARSVAPGYDERKFGQVVPVVYRINLRDPSAYFYARGFMVQDKDVLYIANAKGVEFTKVMKMLNVVSSTAGVGRRFAD